MKGVECWPKLTNFLLSQIFSCKEWFSRFVWHYNFCYNLCDLLRPIIPNHYECVMVSVHDNRESPVATSGRDHLGNYLLSQGTIFTMICITTNYINTSTNPLHHHTHHQEIQSSSLDWPQPLQLRIASLAHSLATGGFLMLFILKVVRREW